MGCISSKKQKKDEKRKTASPTSSLSPTEDQLSTIRFLFIGASGVGKRSILRRILQNTFSDSEGDTLRYETVSDEWEETQLSKKTLDKIGPAKVPFKLFIKAAIRSTDFVFRTQSFRNPYRGMDCIVLVFDMNNMESLDYLKLLSKDVKSFAPEHTYIAVFGNKSDINEKSIPKEELDSIVSSFGIKEYKEVSAKDGSGIEEWMKKAIDIVAEKKFQRMNNSTS